MLAFLGKSLLSGRKKKKSKSGKEMSQQVLNRSENVEEDKRPFIKPQNSLVPLSLKTTTIPTANLITTKEDSIKDKLLMIKDLLGLQLRFRVSSFSQRMESMREERRKNREKELEEKKQKKKKIPFLSSLPKIGILDSLKNFLLFLAGGILLNLLLKNLDVLEGIGKTILSITTGIMQFAKFMWDGVIGFITTAYAGYDALRESVRDIGGDEAVEKFERLSDLLKTVINGAIIAATIALVTRPFLKAGCLPNPRNLRNPRNFRNINNRNNRINNRRTTSGGQQLNRGPFSGMREFFRKFRGGPPISGSGQQLNRGPFSGIREFFRKSGGGPTISGSGQQLNRGPFSGIREFFKKSGGGPSGPPISGNVPKVGFMEGMGTQFRKVGQFLNPKNLTKINWKDVSKGLGVGILVGMVTGAINEGLENSRVNTEATFISKVDSDRQKEEIQRLVDEIKKEEKWKDNPLFRLQQFWGILETFVSMGGKAPLRIGDTKINYNRKILERLKELGINPEDLVDVPLDNYQYQQFIDSLDENKIDRDGSKKESIFEVSKGGSRDALDFMKNIVPVDELAQDTSYSKGSYGLISDITTFIQPIVQEV
tara:strand:+ start:2733 stop:4523 length:1791 start_codon:yes stop_codon:yes gene_type:complete